VLVDGELHAVLDVDASAASGPLSGPAMAIDTAGRWPCIPGGVGPRGTLGALTSLPFLVDLHLLDDLRSVCAVPSLTRLLDWVQPLCPAHHTRTT